MEKGKREGEQLFRCFGCVSLFWFGLMVLLLLLLVLTFICFLVYFVVLCFMGEDSTEMKKEYVGNMRGVRWDQEENRIAVYDVKPPKDLVKKGFFYCVDNTQCS